MLCLFLATPVFAAQSSRMYDSAGLLSTAEADALGERLNTVSDKYRVDVIVATVPTVGAKSIDVFVEDFYDTNGYGFGANHDGVILLVAVKEREYRILSNGLGADAISADEIDDIGEDVAEYLSDGDYVGAFDAFVDACEYQINGEINGFPFAVDESLTVSLIVGFVVALITTGVMAGQLKSVRRQNAAAAYVKPGSMQVTIANDIFLYHTIHRRRKESSKSSSRSGSSRNVGGGRF